MHNIDISIGTMVFYCDVNIQCLQGYTVSLMHLKMSIHLLYVRIVKDNIYGVNVKNTTISTVALPKSRAKVAKSFLVNRMAP